MADASSIRKVNTPLTYGDYNSVTSTTPAWPAGGAGIGPLPGSLPLMSVAGAGFFEGGIRFLYNQPGYVYTYTDSNGISKSRGTGQAFINSGSQWVAVGNTILHIPVQIIADDVSQYVFLADKAYNLVSAQMAYTAAGGTSALFQLTNCAPTSGQVAAPSAGSSMLTAAGLPATAAAGTVITGTLNATLANTQVAAGSAIGLITSGTMTGIAGVTITIVLQPC